MTGRVVIVTGAARGLGAAIVRALLEDDCRVVAADRSPMDDAPLVTAVAAGKAVEVRVDLTDPSSGPSLVATALDSFGACDAVVSNAGIGGPSRSASDLGHDELLEVLRINLLGAVSLCRAAMPSLRASGRGRVVTIGSVFAERPSVDDGAYAMSKAALESLTRSIAVEEGRAGVTANVVAPGYILTDMHRAEASRLAGLAGIDPEVQLATLRERVPVGRHGIPEDVAETVRWLLSPEASYISGQTIRVDGALSIV